TDRDSAIKLIRFGQRNYKFLHSSGRDSVFRSAPRPPTEPPSSSHRLLGLLKHQSQKIDLLRKVVSKINAPNDKLVIRFRCEDFGKREIFAYTTVGPVP